MTIPLGLSAADYRAWTAKFRIRKPTRRFCEDCFGTGEEQMPCGPDDDRKGGNLDEIPGGPWPREFPKVTV